MRVSIYFVIVWWLHGTHSYSIQTNVTKPLVLSIKPNRIRLNCLYDYLRNEQQQNGLNDLIVITNSLNNSSSIENRLIRFLNEILSVKLQIRNYFSMTTHQKSNVLWFAESQPIDKNIDAGIYRNARELFVIVTHGFHAGNIELFARFNAAEANQMRVIILNKCNEKQCQCQLFGATEYGCNKPHDRKALQLPHLKAVCTLNVGQRRDSPHIIGQMMATIANKLHMQVDYLIGQSELSTNIDVSIDRNSIRFNESLSIVTPYAFDSSTWCIRNSGIRPKWQNVFAIFQNIHPLLISFAFYYSMVILLYFQIPFQQWNYDSYCMMLKSLQYLLCQSPVLDIKRCRAAMGIIMWGCFLFYTVIMSFYLILLHRSIPLYQIHTQEELIAEDFQLAGDVHSLNKLKEFEMVSHFFFKQCNLWNGSWAYAPSSFLCFFVFFLKVC